MNKIPIRLWVSIGFLAIGLFRFVQSHFWSSLADRNVHALESAAEFFLGAWLVGAMHYVTTSDFWEAKRTKRRDGQSNG